MTTITRRVKGNRTPAYYLGRPRSVYTDRFAPTETKAVSPLDQSGC